MTQPFASLVALLRQRALRQPSECAYTFLLDGETAPATRTYAELDRAARSLAAELLRRGLRGERALLLYQPSLEYVVAFMGCLYAGVIAVPAYPPRPTRIDRALPRLRAIVGDAQPAIALTTAQFASLDEALSAQSAAFHTLRWLATNTLSGDQAEEWRDPGVDPGTLAFLQYTSGSTAAPKGVTLTHGNLLHNLALIHQAFGHSPASKGVIWLPPYHDMGLIGGVLQPLYGGFPVTLMSPVNFLQRPLRWLEAISRTGATTSGGPNFAYDLCVHKTTSEQRANLDLSSWQVAFTGAEPIRPDTLKRFTEAFAPAGFRPEAWYPCYGLAEATLIVSGGATGMLPVVRKFQAAALEQHRVVEAAEGQDGRSLVSCGQILGDQRVVIVDPSTSQRRTPGEIGEIWISGGSVAQGYWNRTAETEQTFQAYLADSGEGPFLRTGDVGCLHEGELFVTGRLKDLIIIRGRNHYPQDLELTIERSHPALRPASGAAFAVDHDGEERLVIVQEIERLARHQDLAPIVEAMRQALAEQHEVQAHTIILIKPGSIPKTSSGKIQRHQCRANFLAGTLEIVGSNILPADARPEPDQPALTRSDLLAASAATRPALLEAHLREQAARLLRVPAATIAGSQSISALGLDSLLALEWQHAIEIQLGLSVSMECFLEGGSITELVQELLAQIEQPPVKPVVAEPPVAPDDHELPLSAGQRALWFLHQLAPESAAYNIAAAARIRSELNTQALRQSLQALVDRHPLLRAIFVQSAVDGEPVQRIQQSTIWLQESIADWSAAELAERLAQETQRPFDLQRGPLLKVHLFSRSVDEHVLLLVIHHIIADFWSLALLVQELNVLYPAAQAGQTAILPPVSGRYADYVARQATRLSGADGDRLWSYWRQQLAPGAAGELPSLSLPTDRPRPPVQTYRGAAQPFTVSAEITQQLKDLSRAHEATLYMTLLAAFQVLLHRYTGQSDLLVGSPTTGRYGAEVAGIVGYFVNPLVLRGNLTHNPSFVAFLRQIRQTVLSALAHQAYPFALLAQRLQPERDPSRSPLFQTMFVFQKAILSNNAQLSAFAIGKSGAQLTIGGLSIESLALEQQIAQFDLTLMIAEVDGALTGSLQYNTDLFEAGTITRMAEHWQILLAGIATDAERPVAALPLLAEAERLQLLQAWNTATLDHARTQRLHDLFEEQARRTPDAIALIHPGAAADAKETLTYAELNRRADQLALYLRTLGVGRCPQDEVLVGVYLQRSPDLIVALLAILKAGGAYVPLDPAYPAERVAFVREDTRMPVLLTQEALARSWPASFRDEHQTQVLCLDRDWPLIAQATGALPPVVCLPGNLAYVIYTSGSTGRPKGVAITHASAVGLIAWSRTVFTTKQLSRVLAATSVCFDLSVFEIFVPLSVGGTAILVDNVLQLATLPAGIDSTLINTVPSAMTELIRLDAVPQSVHTINLAGEPLTQRLVEQIYQHVAVERIYNLYGPSEDTTYSTFVLIERDDKAAPTIGRPIPCTQAYLLDAQMQPVPLGVAGEIYLGGEGLARGYLHRPDLTAERFIPNPFASGPGSRLYRTGDLGRYLPDGRIVFLGRIDQQIKIRGFRIEPGEIESVLLQHPDVRECVVLAREVAGETQLVAYVMEELRTKNQEPRTPNDDEPGSKFPVPGGSPPSMDTPRLGSTSLRTFLAEHLPEYMMPSAFVVLDALPLTPNGKLDRQALPAPGRDRTGGNNEFVAPRTPVETTLAEIWAQLLDLERVGIHDHFFHLGGHSLLAIQLISRVREKLQIELPVHSLFEAPTIAGLAQHIEVRRWAVQEVVNTTDAEDDLEEGTL